MAMQKETRDLKFKLLIYLSPWLQAGSKKKEKKKNKINSSKGFLFSNYVLKNKVLKMSPEISEVKDEKGHFTVERLLKIRFVKRIRVWLYLLINHPDLRRILVTLIIFQIIFYFYLTKGKTFCIHVRYQL
jgi:hypothetical protein